MELLQNWVLLINPMYGKKSSIHLEGKVQEDLMMEELKKLNELEVFEVGNKAEKIKKGDKVYVSHERTLFNSQRIILEDKDYFLVREQDIILIY